MSHVIRLVLGIPPGLGSLLGCRDPRRLLGPSLQITPNGNVSSILAFYSVVIQLTPPETHYNPSPFPSIKLRDLFSMSEPPPLRLQYLPPPKFFITPKSCPTLRGSCGPIILMLQRFHALSTSTRRPISLEILSPRFFMVCSMRASTSTFAYSCSICSVYSRNGHRGFLQVYFRAI